MGNNDTGEQLEAAKEYIVTLERQLAEARGLHVHEVPEMAAPPDGTALISDFVVHAAMVQPLDPNQPAVPAVQLQVATMQPNDPTQHRTISTLIAERDGAARIAQGITNCVTLLDNLARNQEHPHG